MNEILTASWNHKGLIGTIMAPLVSIVAQTTQTLEHLPGGQLTICGMLLAAIYHLRQEVKAERKESAQARKDAASSQQETIDILKEVSNNHRSDEEDLRMILKKRGLDK